MNNDAMVPRLLPLILLLLMPDVTIAGQAQGKNLNYTLQNNNNSRYSDLFSSPILNSLFLILVVMLASAHDFHSHHTRHPLFLQFLRATAYKLCYSAYYAIARPSVCPSVRPSHGWISQKRLKLGSCNFHHQVAP